MEHGWARPPRCTSRKSNAAARRAFVSRVAESLMSASLSRRSATSSVLKWSSVARVLRRWSAELRSRPGRCLTPRPAPWSPGSARNSRLASIVRAIESSRLTPPAVATLEEGDLFTVQYLFQSSEGLAERLLPGAARRWELFADQFEHDRHLADSHRQTTQRSVIGRSAMLLRKQRAARQSDSESSSSPRRALPRP